MMQTPMAKAACPYGRWLVGREEFLHPHQPLSREALATGAGNLVTVLRQPRERLVSGFLHSLHDCNHLQQRLNLSEVDGEGEWSGEALERLFASPGVAEGLFAEYAACTAGCASNMLTGRWCNGGAPPARQAAEARQVLQGFAFVGLQARP